MKKSIIESLIIGCIAAFAATTLIALFTYHGWQWDIFGGIFGGSFIGQLIYRVLIRGSSLPTL